MDGSFKITRYRFNRQNELKRMWEEGISQKEIAKALGVDKGTIAYNAKKMGLPPRERKDINRVHIDEAELRRLWESGMTRLDAGKRLGCSEHVMRARSKEIGLGRWARVAPGERRGEEQQQRICTRKQTMNELEPRGPWTPKLDRELFRLGGTWAGRTEFQAKHPQIGFTAIQSRWHQLQGPIIDTMEAVE